MTAKTRFPDFSPAGFRPAGFLPAGFLPAGYPPFGFALAGPTARRRRTRALTLSASLLATVAVAEAPGEGDPAAGGRFAAAVCAECHQISRTEPAPPTPAPAFHDLAARPGQNARMLELLLATPHTSMPTLDLMLDNAERADVIAYILSLRPDPETAPGD